MVGVPDKGTVKNLINAWNIQSTSRAALRFGLIAALLSSSIGCLEGGTETGTLDAGGGKATSTELIGFSDSGWQGKATSSSSSTVVAEWVAARAYQDLEVHVFEGATCAIPVLVMTGINPSQTNFSFESADHAKTYSFRVRGRAGTRMFSSNCSGGIAIDRAINCQGARRTNAPFANSGEAGVDGSAGNPFLICTATQFGQIVASTSNWDKHFHLGDNIDLTGYSNVIGTSATPFTGTLNGQNFTISNFTLTSWGTNDVGLFGYLGTGSAVRNLRLNNGSVSAARENVGLLAGWTLGTIENITVRTATVRGNGALGGLIGQTNNATVTNVTMDGIFVETLCGSCSTWGGFVGQTSGTTSITNGQVSGRVIGAFTRTGGFVGRMNSGTISQSRAYVNVRGGFGVGGFIGNNGGGTISRSFASGTVQGTGGVGGFLGGAEHGTITRSGYVGSLVEATSDNAGGFLGGSFVATYTNNYAIVDRVAAANSAGGFMGNAGWDTIRDNYVSVGLVLAQVSRQGGFVGADNNGSDGFRSTYQRNFWDNKGGLTSGFGDNPTTHGSVTGLSTSLMQTTSTYSGWDTNFWNFVDGQYPEQK